MARFPRSGKSLRGKALVFAGSFSPRLSAKSARAAEDHLGSREAALFMAMSRYDRSHSLRVAACFLGEPTMVRAALLHDTGKLSEELPVWFRMPYTALEIACPRLLERLQRRVEAGLPARSAWDRLAVLPGLWRRALFTQSHHGELAAELLESMGCEVEVVHLVRYHQGVAGPEDEALARFIQADSTF